MDIKENSIRLKIVRGADNLNIQLTDQQSELLLRYLLLFEKWNKAYNLSAVRNVDEMVSRHLLDSLTVLPYIKSKNILDVGTGGGLPGIPLAIIFPDKKITLIDSNGKKTRFLFQVLTELNLKNVSIQNIRVEDFRPKDNFDGIISRAFASLKDMTDYCNHLLTDDGYFYAMKGLYPTEELSAISANYKLCDCFKLHVPGEESERNLLLIKPLR